jgi:hypothetical protein
LAGASAGGRDGRVRVRLFRHAEHRLRGDHFFALILSPAPHVMQYGSQAALIAESSTARLPAAAPRLAIGSHPLSPTAGRRWSRRGCPAPVTHPPAIAIYVAICAVIAFAATDYTGQDISGEYQSRWYRVYSHRFSAMIAIRKSCRQWLGVSKKEMAMGRRMGSLTAAAALAAALSFNSGAVAQTPPAPAPAENAAPTADNAVLLTIFLKHDQSRPLGELNAQLEKQGFYKAFPPSGIEVVSWYVMMGIGQVVTLRLPASRLREVNRILENTAWGSYRTEFYPTYDYKAVGIAAHDKAQ